MAVELATEYALYPSDWDFDVLSCISSAQGLPPDHVLHRGQLTSYNCQQRNGHWTLKTPETFGRETGYCTRTSFPMLNSLDEIKQMMGNDGEHQSDQHLFMDLIKRMLHLDPEQRIKPQEVTQHPFLAQNLPMDKKEIPDQIAGQVYIGVKAFKMKSKTFDERAKNIKMYPLKIFGECYEVVDKLGQGGFGFVTKSRNIKTSKMVAIECILDHPNTVDQAKREIAILEKLQCLDPDTCNIVQ